jgi:hypothetical protein
MKPLAVSGSNCEGLPRCVFLARLFVSSCFPWCQLQKPASTLGLTVCDPFPRNGRLARDWGLRPLVFDNL